MINQEVVVERVMIGPRPGRHLIDVRPLSMFAIGWAVGKKVVHHRRTGRVVYIELDHPVVDDDVVVEPDRV